MKKRKIALYDPYLDVMGGGEKHILSIAKALDEDAELTIFWNENLNDKIAKTFDLTFSNEPIYHRNIFAESTSQIDKVKILSQFDVFFYVTDGSYFISPAKKNIVFSMYPQRELYPQKLIDKIKTMNYMFVANSHYTANWLQKWGLKPKVLYPYVEDEFINTDISKIKKEKTILSVGRFFNHLHSKRHDITIDAFKKLKKHSKNFSSYKLILAGNLKDEDKYYFKELQEMAKDDGNIFFKPNVSYKELIDLYKNAQIYWHCAGYGINDEINPERVEHFGITPIEAMAFGCLVFCVNAGGPKELIKNGENGYLFTTIEDLIEKTQKAIDDKDVMATIKMNAHTFAKENFSYAIFKNKVQEILT